MTNGTLKTPDLSVFALALVLVLALAAQFGGTWWEIPIGCIVIGGGGWSTWQLGRWLWLRNGPERGGEMIR
jgi:hypothetical protein